MVTRAYGVDKGLDTIFDDDFGLSEGSDSEDEGEGIHTNVGEAILLQNDVKAIGNSIIDHRG